MPSQEQDVIAHLLKVEEEAAELIREAQDQSDKEISGAKAKAQKEYADLYETMASQMEADFNEKSQGVEQNHKTQIQEYKSQIEKTPKDAQAFDALLEKIF